MTIKRYVAFLPLLLVPLVVAQPADDPMILKLATCQESFLDWKDPIRQKRFLDKFDSTADYDIQQQGYYLIPRKPATLLGYKIVALSPRSLGQAPGFSVFVEGRFDAIKSTLEKQIGHTLDQCDASHGARSCSHKLDESRTVMLMGDKAQTIFGCGYPYQK